MDDIKPRFREQLGGLTRFAEGAVSSSEMFGGEWRITKPHVKAFIALSTPLGLSHPLTHKEQIGQ
jgi:hypothetical protein